MLLGRVCNQPESPLPCIIFINKSILSSNMKGGHIAVIVLVVIIALGVGGFFYLTGSSETVAYLNVHSGNVEVNQGSGWQTANDQMELKQSDYVRTLDGEASIVFFESDIMELKPNTEVSLTELVADSIKINQNSGETWNRVSKLTGTRDYEVETPTSVATVRGTGFGVIVLADGSEVVVDEGVVDCNTLDRTNLREIREFRSCLIRNGEISERDLTVEQLRIARRRTENAINELKAIQKRELYKKRLVVNAIKKRYNLTDDDVDEFIDDINNGKRDLRQIREKTGIQSKSVDKMVIISEKIRQLSQRLKRIDEKLASMV